MELYDKDENQCCSRVQKSQGHGHNKINLAISFILCLDWDPPKNSNILAVYVLTGIVHFNTHSCSPDHSKLQCNLLDTLFKKSNIIYFVLKVPAPITGTERDGGDDNDNSTNL